MADKQSGDGLALLDRPEVSAVLFHPRREPSFFTSHGQAVSLPGADGQEIGGFLHTAGENAPTILFFHGNGEIAADYDELAQQYTKRGLNFLPVDYRGYGRSSGSPSVSSMLRDCHEIFAAAERLLTERGLTGPLLVMGRSLGSASALELAAAYPERVAGLIIESGFAFAAPLLRLMGLDMQTLGLAEEDAFDQLTKITAYTRPTLIIHAELDQIIPFSDGETLFQASPARDKRFLPMPGANHNDILFRDLASYMKAVRNLADTV